MARCYPESDDVYDVSEDEGPNLHEILDPTSMHANQENIHVDCVSKMDFVKVEQALLSTQNRLTSTENRMSDLEKEVKRLKELLDSIMVESGQGSKLKIVKK